MTISISIENSPAPITPITVPWVAGMNVQQALEAAYNQVEQTNPGDFTFGLQFYGTYQADPLGYLLVMVNGVEDEPDQGSYWELLLNGQPAMHGIDSTILQDGDAVTLRNETYDEETHQGTHLGRKQEVHAARRR